MRLFPPFHPHLFQVWDSLSAAFSFSPGSHHKSPAVVQLFTIAGNQQNQILGCYLFYVVSSFVFPFCMCVEPPRYTGLFRVTPQKQPYRNDPTSHFFLSPLGHAGVITANRKAWASLLNVRVWPKETHAWRMERHNSRRYHSALWREVKRKPMLPSSLQKL